MILNVGSFRAGFRAALLVLLSIMADLLLPLSLSAQWQSPRKEPKVTKGRPRRR